jgi:hypothetical protein
VGWGGGEAKLKGSNFVAVARMQFLLVLGNLCVGFSSSSAFFSFSSSTMKLLLCCCYFFFFFFFFTQWADLVPYLRELQTNNAHPNGNQEYTSSMK